MLVEESVRETPSEASEKEASYNAPSEEDEEEPWLKYASVAIQATPSRRNARTQVSPKLSFKSKYHTNNYYNPH